jgi:uncharacterized damage-inducible protein DinB
MHPSVAPLAGILRLNTELLLNCLAGLDDAMAALRLTPSTNNAAFLVAHLVDSRHFLAATLGAPLANPLTPVLAGARSLDDIAPLPSLAELAATWEAISAHLAVLIERLDTPALAAPVVRALPGGDATILGSLTFLVQHDCYHLGQLGLLRRQLGLPAMAYAIAPREPGRRGA